MLLSLRNGDSEDAILHARRNRILINADREGERAGKFADGTLRDPVLGFGDLWLRLLGGDFGGLLLGGSDSGGVFILDGSLVGLGSGVGMFDGGLGGSAFDGASWWSAGSVGALGFAADSDGLAVGKLDLDVLLFDAWKITVELVSLGQLLDVEFGGEGLYDWELVAVMSLGVAVLAVLFEVVEETEEWVEGGVGGWGGSEERAWEERHLAGS